MQTKLQITVVSALVFGCATERGGEGDGRAAATNEARATLPTPQESVEPREQSLEVAEAAGARLLEINYDVIKTDVVGGASHAGRFDLVTPVDEQREIVNATAMILRTEYGPDHALFDPSNKHTRIPIYPHCRKRAGQDHIAFNCEDRDRSFNQHAKDYILSHAIGWGTASFIDPSGSKPGESTVQDLVVTARHVIKTEPYHMMHTYVMMNKGHGGNGTWKLVDTDNDNEPDHLEVETKYLLVVEDPPVNVSTGAMKQSDWIVLRVKPFAVNESIPEHPVFRPSSDIPPVGTEILVPSHPRLLPLKIADGVTAAPPPGETAMGAIFDVSGGSSGAPLLLASDPMTIIGVNRGRSFLDGRNVLPQEFTCHLDALGTSCGSQPVSPSLEFK